MLTVKNWVIEREKLIIERKAGITRRVYEDSTINYSVKHTITIMVMVSVLYWVYLGDSILINKMGPV